MRAIAKPHTSCRLRLPERTSHVIRPGSRRWAHHDTSIRWQGSSTRLPASGPGPGRRPTSRLRCISDSSSSRKISDPTIYALSSGAGRAAIAVIRVSGHACLDVYHALCPGRPIPKPREASVRTLYYPGGEPSRDKVLDSNALLLFFPGPRSATGEDVLEFHVHGGPAVVKAVLAAVRVSLGPGRGDMRYAEPGEFTRRAFLNDRLDLTQVEALGNVLTAETEQQRQLSVRGTSNSLSKLYEVWRTKLLYARGELEALIDFSEDQHFDESPADLCISVAAQVKELRRILRIHSQNAVRGELLRNGISLALLGAPNAGKSSLLNRIVGREAAIVSHEAGTTRDVVEVGLDIGGYLCRIGDTAGLRKALSKVKDVSSVSETCARENSGVIISRIEEEGIRRAKKRARESDVVVVVLSFEPSNDTASDSENGTIALQIDPEVQQTAALLIRERRNVMIVINKADLAPHAHVRKLAVQKTLSAFPGLSEDSVHLISCAVASMQEAESTVVGTRGQFAGDTTNFPPDRFDPSVRQKPAGATAAATEGEDPGGIQTMLRGLVRQFSQLTNALIDEAQEDAGPAGEELRSLYSGIPDDHDPTSAKATAPSSTTMDLAPAVPKNPAADSAPVARVPSSAAGAASTFWQESLGASVRHRELLDACILHLTAFLTTVEVVGEEVEEDVRSVSGRPSTFGYPAATKAGTTPLGADSSSRGTETAASSASAYANHFPTTHQPYAKVPVPDRPRAGVHVSMDGNHADPDIVIAAEHLRAAAECLARITGRGDAGDVEEVLGVIFENFCVGK